jgi:hypothetical protein
MGQLLQANLQATSPCIDTLFTVRPPVKPVGNQALHRHPFHSSSSSQTCGQPGPASTPFSQSVVERCSYSPGKPAGNQSLHRHPFHSPYSSQTCGQPGPASTPFLQSVVESGSGSPGKPAGNQALHRHPSHSPLWRVAATLQANLRATRPCIDTLLTVRCGEVQLLSRQTCRQPGLASTPFSRSVVRGAATPGVIS